MDFEEQLEKVERLSSPSLVGSSLRSADDSPHNNYIHPEKSRLTKGKAKGGRKPKSDIAASLDDLINEGALLGSEEDFDKFLDDSGNIKDDAKYSGETSKFDNQANSLSSPSSSSSPLKKQVIGSVSKTDSSPLKQVHNSGDSPIIQSYSSIDSSVIGGEKVSKSNEIYSTPNLSEYQLNNQINDVNDLIDSVKSIDPTRLPKTTSYASESSKSNKKTFKVHDLDNPEFKINTQSVKSPFLNSGLHTPYFHTDQSETDRSRSRSNNRIQNRSRSASNKPHLARGDTYKNIHEEEPSKYELPPEFQAQVTEESDERQSRQSKPTMKEKIETLEKQRELEQDQLRQYHDEEMVRDPSLLTTGDYSNFNVDLPQQEERFNDSTKIYAQRSISSTNYLRNISRSRSRQPKLVESDEKNDSNPRELVKEGAFVSDDPYSTIDNLDTMVEEVLNVDASKSLKNKSNPSDDLKSKTVDQKENVNDLKIQNDEGKFESNVSNVVPKAIENEAKASKKLNIGNVNYAESTLLDSELNSDTKKENNFGEQDLVPDQLSEEKKTKLDVTETQVNDEKINKTDTKEIDVPTLDLPTSSSESQENDTSAKLKTNDSVTSKDATESGLVKEREEKEDKEIDKEEGEEEEEEEKELSSKNEISEAVDIDGSVNKDILNGLESHDVSNTEKEDVQAKSVVGVNDDDISAPSENNVTTKDDNGSEDGKSISHEISKVGTAILDKIKDVVVSTDDGNELVDITPKLKAVEVTDEKIVSNNFDAGTKDKSTKEEAAEEEVSKSAKLNTKAEDDIDDFDFEVSPEEIRKHLESQPIYLFTSLAGGMQIMPRTNRLATILQANGIKFEYRDLGTDDEAKKIWKRQADGKTLPGVVRGDDFIGNWKEIDDANEEYKLHELLYETL